MIYKYWYPSRAGGERILATFCGGGGGRGER